MTKRNAIIFSKNEKLSNIVFAELSLLGFVPQILDKPPSESNAEVIVFDSTELEFSSAFKSFITLCHCSKRIAIVNEPSKTHQVKFDSSLSFPFSLSDFRAAILDAEPLLEAEGSDTNLSKCFISSNDSCGVFFNDAYIPLSSSEFKVLKLLCENSGKCVTKNDLLELFDSHDSNILQVYICHLRNKIELPFGIKVIYTVRKNGYMTDYTLK